MENNGSIKHTLDPSIYYIMNSFGSGAGAARTASLTNHQMVTYMDVSTNRTDGGGKENVSNTAAEDEEFRLSSDIDALFCYPPSSSNGSNSNDGGSSSEKQFVVEDEEDDDGEKGGFERDNFVAAVCRSSTVGSSRFSHPQQQQHLQQSEVRRVPVASVPVPPDREQPGWDNKKPPLQVPEYVGPYMKTTTSSKNGNKGSIRSNTATIDHNSTTSSNKTIQSHENDQSLVTNSNKNNAIQVNDSANLRTNSNSNKKLLTESTSSISGSTSYLVPQATFVHPGTILMNVPSPQSTVPFVQTMSSFASPGYFPVNAIQLPTSSNFGSSQMFPSNELRQSALSYVKPLLMSSNRSTVSSTSNPTSTSGAPTFLFTDMKKRSRPTTSSSTGFSHISAIPSPEILSSTISLPMESNDVVPENEDEFIKRRRDRNLREQMRSQKICDQISDLKDILKSSDMDFKPDKFSTLVSVHKYIEMLQERIHRLDQELKCLVQTIATTNSIVNKNDGLSTPKDSAIVSLSSNPSSVPSWTTSGRTTSSTGTVVTIPTETATLTAAIHEDGKMIVKEERCPFNTVQTLDYVSVFSHCMIPWAIIRVDGRVLECNGAFTDLFCITRDQMGLSMRKRDAVSSDIVITKPPVNQIQRTSLFHLLSFQNLQPLYVAMSKMLEGSTWSQQKKILEDMGMYQNDPYAIHCDYWSGVVYACEKLDMPLQICFKLIRDANGCSKYFNCVVFKLK